jgi:hypothetical protein
MMDAVVVNASETARLDLRTCVNKLKKYNKPREVKPRGEAEKLGAHDAVSEDFARPSRRRRMMMIVATIIAKAKREPKVAPSILVISAMSDNSSLADSDSFHEVDAGEDEDDICVFCVLLEGGKTKMY